MNKTFFSFFLTIFISQILFGQEYKVYKSKIDTSFVSAHLGYEKKDLVPEVKVALSAMTVLTVYQMKNYAVIKF